MSIKLAEQEDIAAALAEWLAGHSLEPGSLVVKLTGISKSQWYRYIGNQVPIPHFVSQKLYAVIPNTACYARMCGAAALGLVVSEVPPAERPSGVYRSAMRAGAASGKVQATVHRIMADGVIVPGESAEAAQDIDEAQRELETLRIAVTAKAAQ